MLTLCGFLLAEALVCLKRSGFENPERARGGALERSWGHLPGGTEHPAGARPPRVAAAGRGCASPGCWEPGCPWAPRPQLQESCGEAVTAHSPPGTRRRGTRRHGASLPCPIPTRARQLETEATGPHFQDKMPLPENMIAPQTGWSVPCCAMEDFPPQPRHPAPHGSSPEVMTGGSGPQGCGGSGKHRGGCGLLLAADPPADLAPGLANPCPDRSPSPGGHLAGCEPASRALPGETLALRQSCSRHNGASLAAFGRCQRGRRGLLGSTNFSRRTLTPCWGRAGAGREPLHALGGRTGPWKPGFLVAAGYASRLVCSRQGQLLSVPGDGTQQRLWLWGRLLTGLEAGAPSATAEPGAGRRRVSKCV